MPLYSLAFGLQTASPLFAILGFVGGVVLLLRERRSLHWQNAWPLLLGMAPGVGLGVWLLHRAPEDLLLGLLGILTLSFAAIRLRAELRPRGAALDAASGHPPTQNPPVHIPANDFSGQAPARRGGRWIAVAAGFAGGTFGGALNTNGPPVVAYAATQPWTPPEFRAVLQTFFLSSGVIVLAAHGASGLWRPSVFLLLAAAAPAFLLALWAGARLTEHVSPERFRLAVLLLLGAFGLLLVFTTLFRFAAF